MTRLLFALVIMTSAITAHARSNHFGFHAGPQFTTSVFEGEGIFQDTGEGGSTDTGVSLGFQYMFRFSDRWALRSGVELSNRNFNYQTKPGGAEFLNVDVIFAELPAIMQFYISEKWGVYAGVKLAFNVSTKCKGSSSSSCNANDVGDSASGVLGGQWNFAEHSAVELFVERSLVALSEVSSLIPGLDGTYELHYSGVGIRYVHWF